jgi:hypothetical protein
LKRTHNASTHHHIKELIALKINGYNLINEVLNPVDEIIKQWSHRKSWNHMKSLLFYSGNTNNLLKPLEEWGDNVKIIVGYTKFNISTTTHQFPINISAFKRSILAEKFQLFDQCIPTNIDPDMTILDDMIVTQFQGRILVCHKNFNNSTTTDLLESLTSALARYTLVDALQVIDHLNSTSNGKDTIICVSGNISQFQCDILFVVTNLITPEQIVCFKPTDQR